MRTGIFGGTFDPVHNGHTEIAKTAMRELKLDRLIILPSGDPPHKKNAKVTDKYARFEMAKLAFWGTCFEVSDFELKKENLSYTCETLEHFSKELDGDIYFIIGGDSLKNLTTWKCPEKILSLASLYVVGREVDSQNVYTEKYPEKIVKSNAEISSISSTEIRLMSRFGLDISGLVPERVDKYIKENGLYKKDFGLTQKVREYLKPERYVHTFNVALCAEKYAKALGVDEEDAFIAATLHDVAKYVDPSSYKERLESEGFYIPKPCVHAFVGSYMAKDVFGIESDDIINAIKYHTTGRAGMSALEKLIFLCDTIERSRNFDGVEKLRNLADENFDAACIKYLEETVSRIKKEDLCPITRDALEDMRSKYGTKSIS